MTHFSLRINGNLNVLDTQFLDEDSSEASNLESSDKANNPEASEEIVQQYFDSAAKKTLRYSNPDLSDEEFVKLERELHDGEEGILDHNKNVEQSCFIESGNTEDDDHTYCKTSEPTVDLDINQNTAKAKEEIEEFHGFSPMKYSERKRKLDDVVNHLEMEPHVEMPKRRRKKVDYSEFTVNLPDDTEIVVDSMYCISYLCSICDHQFSNHEELQEHKITVHSLAHKCEKCSDEFLSAEELKTHEDKKHGNPLRIKPGRPKGSKNHHPAPKDLDVLRVCDECDFTTKDLKTLLEHNDVEHKGVEYCCFHCDFKAKFKSKLIKHIGSIHKFVCSSCNQLFGGKRELKRHMKTEHKDVLKSPMKKLKKKRPLSGILQKKSTPIYKETLKTNKAINAKKSQFLLNQIGLLKTPIIYEEEEQPVLPKKKDPFNISNDEFYLPKNKSLVPEGDKFRRHSIPSVTFQAPFIPMNIPEDHLKRFHRPALELQTWGPLSYSNVEYGIHSLDHHQDEVDLKRSTEMEEKGGGDIFLMWEPKDLTGKDGDMVLVEYMEEFPPLLSFPGMCSRVKNYYKKENVNSDENLPTFRIGTTSCDHKDKFLGKLHSEETVRTLENNLCRAPIYEHQVPENDFVVIRTRNEFSIREADALFVAGQQCPLVEVYKPQSKQGTKCSRDFLQLFIYRLFLKSSSQEKTLKMDDIREAFPDHSESSIRKRLKPCSTFHRTGKYTNLWVLSPTFRLPTEEELRAMVSPEQMVSYWQMKAEEVRLQQMGYEQPNVPNLTMISYEEECDDLKAASWNTTRAFIQAMQGKTLLDIKGPGDPTGPAQKGFSYIKIRNKGMGMQNQLVNDVKVLVTNTDADLRKLKLMEARDILKKHGIAQSQIDGLTRWQAIDCVRTLSTEKIKAGEEGGEDKKFDRGNRFSKNEIAERYRRNCQERFEIQNKELGDNNLLITDDDESDCDDEEDLDSIPNKGNCDVKQELDHKTLQDFLDIIDVNPKVKVEPGVEKMPNKKEEEKIVSNNEKPKEILRITRTFKNEDGTEYKETELVSKSDVIDQYVKIRNTKNEKDIRKEFTSKERKLQLKKEKRRKQEQLRRVKRNEKYKKLGLAKNGMPLKKKKKKITKDLKIKCGNCGETGHMQTNKICPMFCFGERNKFGKLIPKEPTSEAPDSLESELPQTGRTKKLNYKVLNGGKKTPKQRKNKLKEQWKTKGPLSSSTPVSVPLKLEHSVFSEQSNNFELYIDPIETNMSDDENTFVKTEMQEEDDLYDMDVEDHIYDIDPSELEMDIIKHEQMSLEEESDDDEEEFVYMHSSETVMKSSLHKMIQNIEEYEGEEGYDPLFIEPDITIKTEIKIEDTPTENEKLVSSTRCENAKTEEEQCSSHHCFCITEVCSYLPGSSTPILQP